MPNALLSLDELQTYLAVPKNSDNELLQALLDAAFDQLLTDTNRQGRPFQAAQSGRTEVKRGQSAAMLVLDYPIGTLTSITLGNDPNDPDETLVLNDPTLLAWAPGERAITRIDGSSWGCSTDPRYIHVLYDTLEFRPAICKAALMRCTAQLYRNRGSEAAREEEDGNARRVNVSPFSKDSTWMIAVQSHWEAFR